MTDFFRILAEGPQKNKKHPLPSKHTLFFLEISLRQFKYLKILFTLTS